MPIYEFKCSVCGNHTDKYLPVMGGSIDCCGKPMDKLPSFAMIKIKGEGGYPSRRRQIFNTTSRKHPKLNPEKNKTYYYGGKT